MNNHIKTLGVLYILFGLLGIIVTTVLLNALAGHGAILGKSRLPFSVSGFGLMLAIFFAAASAPGLVGGTALLLRQRWARFVLLALGFINLFNIPLGTILGIYTLWVLMRDESVAFLDPKGTVEPLPKVFPPYR